VLCSFCLVLTSSVFAVAQIPVELQFGLRTGVPFDVGLTSRLTGPASIFSAQAFDRSAFTLGPTVAALIHDRVAVEFDALYKPIKFRENVFSSITPSSSTTRGSSWEFPLLGNYRFLSGPARPFGGGGILLSATMSGTTEGRTVDTRTGVETSSTSRFRSFFKQLPAYVVNGGLEWRTSHVVVRPELRYTHWSSVSQSTSVARREDQFEYLIGFSFRGFRR